MSVAALLMTIYFQKTETKTFDDDVVVVVVAVVVAVAVVAAAVVVVVAAVVVAAAVVAVGVDDECEVVQMAGIDHADRV